MPKKKSLVAREVPRRSAISSSRIWQDSTAYTEESHARSRKNRELQAVPSINPGLPEREHFEGTKASRRECVRERTTQRSRKDIDIYNLRKELSLTAVAQQQPSETQAPSSGSNLFTLTESAGRI